MVNLADQSKEQLQQEIADLRQRVQELESRITHPATTPSATNEDVPLDNILDMVIDAIISVDQTFTIIRFNKGAESMFGYTAAEAIGQPLNILLPQGLHEKHDAHMETFQHAHETTRYMGERMEVYGRRKSGEEFPAEVSISKADINGATYYTAVMRDITAYERLEQELQQNQERYRILNQMNSDYAYSFNVDENGKTYNRWVTDEAFKRVTGYEFDEIKQCHIFHPDDRARANHDICNTIDNGLETAGEYRIMTKAGGERWLRIRRRAIVNETTKKTEKIYCIAEDITRRKRLEEALHESEERYRIFSELSSDYAYAFDLDADGQLLKHWLTESSYKQVTGYDRSELKSSYDIFHPDDVDRAVSDYKRTIAQRIESAGEYRIISKSGETRWLRLRRRAMHDSQRDGVVRVYGVAEDITERKRLEETVKENERRNSIIASMISDYTYEYKLNPDGTGKFIWITEEAFTHITGYSAYDIDNNYRIYHPDERERIRADLDKVIAGAIISEEYRIITKQGEERWIHVHRKPKMDDQNKVIGFYGAISDITQNKLAEEQKLQIALEQERVEILSNFITYASHQFRTPMSVIKTSTYLLGKSTQDEKYHRHIQKIDNQVKHINTLVENMLTMSGLDRIQSLDMQACDLGDILNSIARQSDFIPDDKSLNIQLDVHEAISIHADAVKLQQAIERIWSNAIEYTSDGGRISVTLKRQDDTAVIEIADTGVGIAPDRLKHIFHSFHREDTAGTTRGFGLGLSIAQRIVNLHGGHIEVESKLGTGSTFRIILPITLEASKTKPV